MSLLGLNARTGSVILDWSNPLNEPFFAGVAILRSTAGYVSSYQASAEVHRTNGIAVNTWTDINVTPGQTYYYSLFVYDDQGDYSDPLYIGVTVPTNPGGPTPTPVPTPSSTPPTSGGGGGLSVTPFPVLTPSPVISVSAKLSDYGLSEGDVVSAASSDDPDIYIVNEHGYKRLFLNPVIFTFYGHLGGFQKVRTIAAPTRDIFRTSGLFRNCETNDPMVYGVEVTGEDTGILHHINISGVQAVSEDPDFFKKVFCINNNEFNWYSKGSSYNSLSLVPRYQRN